MCMVFLMCYFPLCCGFEDAHVQGKAKCHLYNGDFLNCLLTAGYAVFNEMVMLEIIFFWECLGLSVDTEVALIF